MEQKYARVIDAERGYYKGIVKIEEEGHQFGTYARSCDRCGHWFWENQLQVIDREQCQFDEKDLYNLKKLLHIIEWNVRNEFGNKAIDEILKLAKKEILESYDTTSIAFEILLFETGNDLEVFREIMDEVSVN